MGPLGLIGHGGTLVPYGKGRSLCCRVGFTKATRPGGAPGAAPPLSASEAERLAGTRGLLGRRTRGGVAPPPQGLGAPGGRGELQS